MMEDELVSVQWLDGSTALQLIETRVTRILFCDCRDGAEMGSVDYSYRRRRFSTVQIVS